MLLEPRVQLVLMELTGLLVRRDRRVLRVPRVPRVLLVQQVLTVLMVLMVKVCLLVAQRIRFLAKLIALITTRSGLPQSSWTLLNHLLLLNVVRSIH